MCDFKKNLLLELPLWPSLCVGYFTSTYFNYNSYSLYKKLISSRKVFRWCSQGNNLFSWLLSLHCVPAKPFRGTPGLALPDTPLVSTPCCVSLMDAALTFSFPSTDCFSEDLCWFNSALIFLSSHQGPHVTLSCLVEIGFVSFVYHLKPQDFFSPSS